MKADKTNGKISSVQAAAMIGVTPGTLRNWRTEKIGPLWHTLRPKTRRKGKGSRPRLYYIESEVAHWITTGRST